MLASVGALWVSGARVCPLGVEADVYRDYREPTAFSLTGAPEPVARASRERLVVALSGCGFRFPSETTRVNLSPASLCIADLAPLELPIATALLLASEQMEHGGLSESALVGELAPDGTLRPVPDVWAMAEAALALRCFERLIVPAGNEADAAGFEGIEVIGLESLRQVPALATT